MGEVEGDMDEHILKVSDNIFMRQEQTRKASIGLPSTKTKTKLPQVNVASTVETNAEIVEAQVKTADNEVKLNGDKSSLVAKPLSLPKVEAKAEIVEDQSKITNKSVRLNGDKSSKIAIDIASDSGNSNISNSIPSSSIDEVIINEITPVVPLRKSKQPKSPTKTDNAVNFSTNNLLTKVEPKPVASKIEQKPLSLPPAQSTKAGQNTIVKSSSPVITQPSITSANSLFGPKIGGNRSKGFGSGKSFVIDP
uniref:Uncharacterized protein n=1 Tax=Ciona savignyi TaxID=51511 RepID=H2ZIR5_CIOSA